MVHRSSLTSAVWFVACLFIADVGWAQTPPCHANGGFESGDFSGWSTIGRRGIVGPGFGVDPTEGSSRRPTSRRSSVSSPAPSTVSSRPWAG